MSIDTIFYSDENDVMITNISFVAGPKTFLLKIINSFYLQKDIAVRGCCSGGIVVVAVIAGLDQGVMRPGPALRDRPITRHT